MKEDDFDNLRVMKQLISQQRGTLSYAGIGFRKGVT